MLFSHPSGFDRIGCRYQQHRHSRPLERAVQTIYEVLAGNDFPLIEKYLAILLAEVVSDGILFRKYDSS